MVQMWYKIVCTILILGRESSPCSHINFDNSFLPQFSHNFGTMIFGLSD